MKLKYDLSTGSVICMADSPDLAGPGVVDVDFSIPAEPLNYFTFNGTSLVRKEQSVIDQIKIIEGFNFPLLWVTVWGSGISDIGAIEMVPYKQIVQDLWDPVDPPTKSQIYPYMQKLVLVGKATAGDLQIIVDAFLDQGIDITTIQ